MRVDLQAAEKVDLTAVQMVVLKVFQRALQTADVKADLTAVQLVDWTVALKE